MKTEYFQMPVKLTSELFFSVSVTVRNDNAPFVIYVNICQTLVLQASTASCDI